MHVPSADVLENNEDIVVHNASVEGTCNVPSTEVLDPTKNPFSKHLFKKIQQQAKRLYDSSFLISSSASSNNLESLSEKFTEVQTFLDSFIEIEPQSNVQLLPKCKKRSVSELPKKRKKKRC